MYCHLGGPILDHIKELVSVLPLRMATKRDLSGDHFILRSLRGEGIPIPSRDWVSLFLAG